MKKIWATILKVLPATFCILYILLFIGVSIDAEKINELTDKELLVMHYLGDALTIFNVVWLLWTFIGISNNKQIPSGSFVLSCYILIIMLIAFLVGPVYSKEINFSCACAIFFNLLERCLRVIKRREDNP